MRERGASSALPPLYFLHVWWARRPLAVSRAAILASLLPAYPDGDPDVRLWPEKFRQKYPSFDAYKQWFLRLVGIVGDPVAGRKLIRWANERGIKLKTNPYGYPRAFTVNPSPDQLADLYDLLEWTWGTREITFSDPMSGGGSIPFEALRYGLTVQSGDLNPVAGVILKATLDYPARFGPELGTAIRKYGEVWAKKVRERLEPFFPLADPADNIFCYIWARTVACPITGKPVPLSPNWWLRKGDDPLAVRVIAEEGMNRCQFQIVRGKAACTELEPDKGTVRKGKGISVWAANEPIGGDYIKARAKAGEMKEQLVAVGIKKAGEFLFRPPTVADEEAVGRADREVEKRWAGWEAKSLIPTEPRREGRADWACEIYGFRRWADTYSPRQLLAMITLVECLHETTGQASRELSDDKARAVQTYLAMAVDIAADYNSKQAFWDSTRIKVAHAFVRHELSLRWSFAEFDGSRNLATYAAFQVEDAYAKLSKLSLAPPPTLFGLAGTPPIDRLNIKVGPAQSLALQRVFRGRIYAAACGGSLGRRRCVAGGSGW